MQSGTVEQNKAVEQQGINLAKKKLENCTFEKGTQIKYIDIWTHDVEFFLGAYVVKATEPYDIIDMLCDEGFTVQVFDSLNAEEGNLCISK